MKVVNAVAAVILKHDKVFCAQRKINDDHGGKWEFPGGGIEKGESNEEALIREIKEELNAYINPDKYLMTVEHDYQEFHLTMPVYLCSIINGNLELKEHMDSKWVKVEELSKIDFADADKKIVAQLLQKSRSKR